MLHKESNLNALQLVRMADSTGLATNQEEGLRAGIELQDYLLAFEL